MWFLLPFSGVYCLYVRFRLSLPKADRFFFLKCCLLSGRHVAGGLFASFYAGSVLFPCAANKIVLLFIEIHEEGPRRSCQK